jgi:hypothetical protein
LKHFRRYNIKEITAVTESAGLTVLKSQYLFSTLFPLAWIFRHLPKQSHSVSQLKDDGKLVNLLMSSFLLLDNSYLKNLPFGLSVIVLAEKGSSAIKTVPASKF